MTTSDYLDRFADLVVRVGANVHRQGRHTVPQRAVRRERRLSRRLGPELPFAVASGEQMSEEERFGLGLNRSAVHTDVVIGGAGMTVTGTGPRGTVDIIRDDEWVLPV